MCLVSRTACMIMCASACFLTAELDVLLCSDGLAHAEILKTRQGRLQLRSPGLWRLLRQQGARKAPRWHLCQTLMYQPGQRIESRPQFACFAVRFMSSLMEHTSCWTQDAVGCTRRGKPSWLPAVLVARRCQRLFGMNVQEGLCMAMLRRTTGQNGFKVLCGTLMRSAAHAVTGGGPCGPDLRYGPMQP